MAEKEQESVLDMDEKETAPKAESQKETKAEAKEKKPAVQINVPFSTIVMICAIATIVIAFLTQFIIIVGGSFGFVTVCRCFKYIAMCATVVLYLVDYLKNKNFNFNPEFICIILSIVVATFVG